jgi:hypothetical protein
MAAPIKNTLIVPGESIGDIKLGMKFGEATKEIDDEVFYTGETGHCAHFFIKKIPDDVSPQDKKRLAGKFFNIDNSEVEKVIKNDEVFKNSIDILYIPISMMPEDFDFFKKNYIINHIETSDFAFYTKDGIRIGMPLYEVEKIHGKLELTASYQSEAGYSPEDVTTKDGLTMKIELDPKITPEADIYKDCGIDYSGVDGDYNRTTSKYSKTCIVKSFVAICGYKNNSPLCPDKVLQMNDSTLQGRVYSGKND